MNKEVSCSKSRDLCPEVPLKSACDLMADKEEGVDGLNLNIWCLRATRICSKRSRAQDV